MKSLIISLLFLLTTILPSQALSKEDQEVLQDIPELYDINIKLCSAKLELIAPSEPIYLQLESLCYDLLNNYEDDYFNMLNASDSSIFNYYYFIFIGRIVDINNLLKIYN